MKKLVILTICLSLGFVSFSQTDEYNESQNMEVVMQQDAYYKAGEMALYQEIFKGIVYSEEAKENKVEGEVMVSFNVLIDGSVDNIIVIQGVGFGVDEEVKRLLKDKKFEVAVQNGEKTKMNLMFNFPVRAH